ncbi:MAG: hypothetical protein AB7J13_14400 [Pyrinomonadaceae bacterium]
MNGKLVLGVLIAAVMLIAACGGASPGGDSSDLNLTIEGAQNTLSPKSSWAYHTSKSFSSSKDGQTDMFTSSSTTVVLANYELDTTQAFISLNKQKLDKPEQIKVSFGFSGEKGTSSSTPIAAGEYVAKKEMFEGNKLEFVTIYRFADGKQQQVSLNEKEWTGSLKINGVSGNVLSGSIDVTDGKNAIKGSFSANGHKSVK